ncbi:MAG: hypothetical protein IJQ93_10505 [Bacteroidales bacterium]|nr:hypothetical protein [Bacteroidales bacterium]
MRNIENRFFLLATTAYDAPMVLAKVNDGAWTPYNIGRDAQGSITHVMTADGEKMLQFRSLFAVWAVSVVGI